jgi:hypothetical protein
VEFLPTLLCVFVAWCFDSFTFYDILVNRLFCMMFRIWCVKLQSFHESSTYPIQYPLLKITSSTLNDHCEQLFWGFSMLLLLLNIAMWCSIDTVCSSCLWIVWLEYHIADCVRVKRSILHSHIMLLHSINIRHTRMVKWIVRL